MRTKKPEDRGRQTACRSLGGKEPNSVPATVSSFSTPKSNLSGNWPTPRGILEHGKESKAATPATRLGVALLLRWRIVVGSSYGLTREEQIDDKKQEIEWWLVFCPVGHVGNSNPFRRGRSSRELASLSSTNCSSVGFQRNGRFNSRAMFARWQIVIERCPTSTGALGTPRVRMQSSQFCKCGRATWPPPFHFSAMVRIGTVFDEIGWVGFKMIAAHFHYTALAVKPDVSSGP